jgi:DNA polymerase I-like protein with 3'-5' exonuclease and polymerase domains
MVYPELESYDDSSDIFQARRKIAKDIFLGLCYGMGGGKLAVTLGLPTEQRQRPDGTSVQVAGPEAQALLDRFDSAVPFVRRLAWRAEERARRRGYIVTLLGRRCRFPVKPDKTFDWTHKALNRLIQGSAADQTKKAMIEVDRAGLPIQLQVHDEICASVESREQAESVARIMCECVKLRVPSKVDLEIGSSWGG